MNMYQLSLFFCSAYEIALCLVLLVHCALVSERLLGNLLVVKVNAIEQLWMDGCNLGRRSSSRMPGRRCVLATGSVFHHAERVIGCRNPRVPVIIQQTQITRPAMDIRNSDVVVAVGAGREPRLGHSACQEGRSRRRRPLCRRSCRHPQSSPRQWPKLRAR